MPMMNRIFPFLTFVVHRKEFLSIKHTQKLTHTTINLSTFQFQLHLTQNQYMKKTFPVVPPYMDPAYERKRVARERFIDHDSILLRIDHLFLIARRVRRHRRKYKRQCPNCFLVTRCNKLAPARQNSIFNFIG